MNKLFNDKQVKQLKAIVDKLNDLSLEIENFRSTIELIPVNIPATSQDILVAQSIACLGDAERASSNAVDNLEEFIYGILPKFK